MRRALITGITGQDGSYLAEFLLAKEYEVHGIVRRSSSFNTGRIDHLYGHPKLTLHYGDLTDCSSLYSILAAVQPDEVYNLAAQSHVRVSFDLPEYTGDIAALGTIRLLEAIRKLRIEGVRFYQASSSEIFGSAPPPQNEATPCVPQSPYACAKLYAYHVVRNYRAAYGMFAVNGILFNHESERRGETFVTRKISRAVGRIVHGLQEKLLLGNLEARRDWGFAGDYVKAMHLMLQAEVPEDYVIGTGQTYSVKDFLDAAFGAVNLQWRDHVEIDPRYFRPTEVDVLCADASKAERELGWRPTVGFSKLVERMVQHDTDLALKDTRDWRRIADRRPITSRHYMTREGSDEVRELDMATGESFPARCGACGAPHASTIERCSCSCHKPLHWYEQE